MNRLADRPSDLCPCGALNGAWRQKESGRPQWLGQRVPAVEAGQAGGVPLPPRLPVSATDPRVHLDFWRQGGVQPLPAVISGQPAKYPRMQGHCRTPSIECGGQAVASGKSKSVPDVPILIRKAEALSRGDD
jgi:hypothetical protein